MHARVKIVATIGPASEAKSAMAALLRAGADVLRLNGAHVRAADLPVLVARARAASAQARLPVAVLVDLPGVKLRIGEVAGGEVEVAPGDLLVLAAKGAAAGAAPEGRRARVVPVPPVVSRSLVRGCEVLFGDGAVAARVVRVGRGAAVARATSGGPLRSRVGVHVRGGPDVGRVPTRQDLALATAAARAGADALALSFVSGPGDLHRLRGAIERAGLRVPLLIAKLERRSGIDRLEEVLESCDGVMVARGDMGLEYGPEEVPGLQKRILDAALRHGRIAITATQMLETMTTATRPTRAEASDVANAVFDGSDAVMLSAETAVGLHPALVVQTMDRILRAAEADPHCPYAGDPRHPAPDADARRPDRLIVRAAVRLAQEAGVAAVVVFTRGGHSARRLAKERPRAPIYAFAPDEAVARGLLVSWGVRPRRLPAGRSTDAVVSAVLRRLRAEEHVPRGSRVVLVVGGGQDPAGTTTLVRLATV